MCFASRVKTNGGHPVTNKQQRPRTTYSATLIFPVTRLPAVIRYDYLSIHCSAAVTSTETARIQIPSCAGYQVVAEQNRLDDKRASR